MTNTSELRATSGTSAPTRLAVVFVLVGVDLQAGRFAHSPQADGEQHDSDQTFAPTGEQFKREGLAEQQGEHPDEHYAKRVADSPAGSGKPGPRRLVCRKGGESRQVIRSGPYMGRSGDESSQGCDHGICETDCVCRVARMH